MFVYTYSALLAFWNAVVAALIGSTPVTKVHLIAAPFTPSPTLTVTGVTEATFDGYAAIAVTGVDSSHIGENGQPVANLVPTMVFTPSGSVTPNTIYGYYLQNSLAPFFGAELFANPVYLDGATTTLQFVANLGMAPGVNVAVILP